MLERMNWNCDGFPDGCNPFTSDQPLKITFHNSSLINLAPAEQEALSACHELAYLPLIAGLQTETGTFPNIEISETYNFDTQGYPLHVKYEKSDIYTTVHFPHNADRLVEPYLQGASKKGDREAILADLKIARAHIKLEQHILITNSQYLLKFRDNPFIKQANPKSPIEAAQIIGLFLRSSNTYVCQAGPTFTNKMNRGHFYWVLARYRLPHMWRYFSACVHAEEARQDDILFLGQSILTRCVRILQARDAIGVQFYGDQHNDSQDEMLYHFDYLTLLVVGIFDAMARIAYRAHRLSITKGTVSGPDAERYADLKDKDFRQELKKFSNARNLYDLISDQYFSNFRTMSQDLRNTIHGAGLTSLTYSSGHMSKNDASYIMVPPSYKSTLWNAAKQSWNSEQWGLAELPSGQAVIEPYTYASMLVSECFKLVDLIAEATDVVGLFPDRYSIPQLEGRPPVTDKIFGDVLGRRLSVLA